jgi:hypothetical protein
LIEAELIMIAGGAEVGTNEKVEPVRFAPVTVKFDMTEFARACLGATDRITGWRRTVMVPRFVVPPWTGGRATEFPARTVPSVCVSKTLTPILPRIVGTPEIENEPSAAVIAVRFPSVVTVAPGTGTPLMSTAFPMTVVNGSGITLIWTF